MCGECQEASVGVDEGDALLLGRVARGDGAAFARLYRFYSPRLISWFALCRDARGMARDLRQDVMLRIWCDAGHFSFRSARPADWIFALALDSVRSSIAAAPSLPAPPDPAGSRAPPPEITAALNGLPPEVLQSLHLVVVQGLTHRAAAARLGVPLGTLKSMVSRGTSRLRHAHRQAAARRPGPAD